jgi:hypothetical protein
MTPDQFPGTGTNPNQFYMLSSNKLQLVPPGVWGIETLQIELLDESGGLAQFDITDFVANIPVTKREAACTLSPDVRQLPPEYQRATWDL